ncbi:hypothetical protein HY493_04875 [Candidatus Woesearchaeota archaeon]|nr:hypothetical protein [Candidatus Woesearchaeota archaeon]
MTPHPGDTFDLNKIAVNKPQTLRDVVRKVDPNFGADQTPDEQVLSEIKSLCRVPLKAVLDACAARGMTERVVAESLLKLARMGAIIEVRPGLLQLL